jgi:hypothetical protein
MNISIKTNREISHQYQINFSISLFKVPSEENNTNKIISKLTCRRKKMSSLSTRTKRIRISVVKKFFTIKKHWKNIKERENARV